MLAKLFTYSLFGIEAKPVEVEVDISPGAMPKTILVGLAEAAVRESTHRVERALVNSGYSRPIDRIVINLSPADLPKDAPSFDLPIALGLLTASGQLMSERFDRYAAVGELALDGTLRPIKGALSMALSARQQGRRGILVPVENAKEAAVVDGIDVFAIGSLAEAVGFYTEQIAHTPVEFSWDTAIREHGSYDIDYSDVKGQEMAKRAVTVAAAGSHHLLMLGSPGTGEPEDMEKPPFRRSCRPLLSPLSSSVAAACVATGRRRPMKRLLVVGGRDTSVTKPHSLGAQIVLFQLPQMVTQTQRQLCEQVEAFDFRVVSESVQRATELHKSSCFDAVISFWEQALITLAEMNQRIS